MCLPPLGQNGCGLKAKKSQAISPSLRRGAIKKPRSVGYQVRRTRFDEAGDLFPETKRLPISARLPIEVERLATLGVV